jgi:hypothetical protein
MLLHKLLNLLFEYQHHNLLGNYMVKNKSHFSIYLNVTFPRTLARNNTKINDTS